MIQNKKLLEEITIIVVSFFSDKRIYQLIPTINENIKIIIVENSLNLNFKKQIEQKYKNIKVVIPKENLGNGGGWNEGLKYVDTEFVLILDPDVLISEFVILRLIEEAKRIKEFAVLAPKISGQNYNEFIIEHDHNVGLNKISYSTGCAMLLNFSVIKELGGFDQNFFLYFEEADLYKRCMDINKHIYLIEDTSVEHIGTSSINPGFELKSRICRNWHYCWSKFYFYKKHYNYFYALRKTFPNLKRSIINYIKNKIKKDNDKALVHKAEFQGMIASYLLKKPYYRI